MMQPMLPGRPGAAPGGVFVDDFTLTAGPPPQLDESLTGRDSLPAGPTSFTWATNIFSGGTDKVAIDGQIGGAIFVQNGGRGHCVGPDLGGTGMWVEMVMGQSAIATGFGIGVRVGATAEEGYFFECRQNNATNNIRLYRYSGSSSVKMGGNHGAAFDEKVRWEISGTTLELYIDGTLEETLTVTDFGAEYTHPHCGIRSTGTVAGDPTVWQGSFRCGLLPYVP